MTALKRFEGDRATMPAGSWQPWGDMVLVSCPRCGCRSVISPGADDVTIDEAGAVSGVHTCPNEVCRFEDELVLEGWHGQQLQT
jgi:hypothetical protein